MAEATDFKEKALEIAFEIVLSVFNLKDQDGNMKVLVGEGPDEVRHEGAVNVAREIRAVYDILTGKRH